jgi:hypothetical protein
MKTQASGNGSCTSTPEFLFGPDGRQLAPTKPNGNHPGHSGNDAPASRETLEVASAQLEGGGDVEIVEDRRDRTRTRLAVSRSGVVHFVDSLEDRGRVLVPFKRDGSILSPIRLPRGVQPYQSPTSLAQEVGNLVNTIVPIPQGLQRIFGAFAVHTWISDQLLLSPCLIIRGPLEISLPLLQALALVCQRAVVVGDATSAGVLKVCSQLNPTLLVVNFGLRPAVLRTLGMGTRRGVLVIQKAGVQSPFGPKLVATTKLPGDLCLLGDCLLLSLGLSGSPDVAKLLDPQINERADYLQECLLQLRFDLLSSVRPLGNELPGPFPFRGKDLMRCLGAPFAGDEQFVADLHKAAKRFCTVPSHGLRVLQRTVVSALLFLTHQREDQQSLLVGELAELADELLEEQGEEMTLSPRKVGAILKDLELARRTRTGDGYELLLDRSTLQQIHMLARFHNAFDVARYAPGGMSRSRCEFCREFRLVSEAAIRHYEDVEKPLIEQQKREAQAELEKRWEKSVGKRRIASLPDPRLDVQDQSPSGSTE